MVATSADFEARGAIARLFREWDKHREILIDGPAGTGKSRGVGEFINWFATNFPGSRILVVRKTLVSLRQSWQVTYEEKVMGHRSSVVRGQNRLYRTQYSYPNGTTVVLGGMDNPTRLFSTEYDLVYVNEATEFAEDEWESLHRCLRNGVAPHQLLLGDCNPDAENHWLNIRADTDVTERILSRFKDNPALQTPEGEEYLERLDKNLSGARRSRLFLGLWVSAEGQIFPEWDAAVHCVDKKPKPGDKGVWFVGVQDWGFRAPGCFQVWAVTPDEEAYRVEEIYYAERQIDWWADQVATLQETYKMRVILCDPSEPASIAAYNQRLGTLRGRDGKALARAAENEQLAGIDALRSGLTGGVNGTAPRMYWSQDAFPLGADKELASRKGKPPTCFEQEVPVYTYMQPPAGKVLRSGQYEKEDPTCQSHAIDCARYFALWFWRLAVEREQKQPAYAPGTMGDIYKHEERLRGLHKKKKKRR